MRVLLDTHILLWWLSDDRRLPKDAEKTIMDSNNEVYVSAASIWEIAIKAALGQIKTDPFAVQESIAPSGMVELAVTGTHATQVSRLPHHHRDPFDRLLIAQSLVEPMRLLTTDKLLVQYGATILLV